MFTIKLAGHIFGVETKFPYVEMLCADYVFEGPPELIVRISEEERKAEDPKRAGYPEDYLESLAVYRKISEWLIMRDVLLFHASALMVDGKAFLFLAPSGVGKSTHARLWREYFGERVVMINDDKPLIRIQEDGVWAYGTPYGGKHHLQTNCRGKVHGLIWLKRGEKNKICRLTEASAFAKCIKNVYHPQDGKKWGKVLDLVKRITKLPCYEMTCNISREAVKVAIEGLKEESI